jgi:hypothetical protein
MAVASVEGMADCRPRRKAAWRTASGRRLPKMPGRCVGAAAFFDEVPVMSWPEIIALAVLPAFLLLDLLKPAARGDGRARWWRSRAFAVTASTSGWR